MMLDSLDPEKLRERIRLGEDARTELKDERAHSDELASEVVAFANSSGGELILGASDDGKLLGVGDPDGALLRIDNICRQSCEPPIGHATAEKALLDGLVLLVVHVPRGPQRPYRTNKGVYYVRGLAGKRIATRQELLEIYQSTEALKPDELPVEDADEGAIDRDYLLKVRPELDGLPAHELHRALMAIKVLTRDGHPSIAGLVCFGRHPQAFRPYARITAIRHRGVDVGNDLLDSRDFDGHVEQQIRSARAFLRDHLASPARVLSDAEPPWMEPPLEAVDEAIVNAVAHRDYLANAQIRLQVFDDRVEVISPGLLLNSVTIDTLKLGCHAPRNLWVFAHLARLRLARDAGLGIPNMLALARQHRTPEPEFELRGPEMWVTFRRGSATRGS